MTDTQQETKTQVIDELFAALEEGIEWTRAHTIAWEERYMDAEDGRVGAHLEEALTAIENLAHEALNPSHT